MIFDADFYRQDIVNALCYGQRLAENKISLFNIPFLIEKIS